MKRLIAIAVSTVLLATLACSVARSEQNGDIWLSGFLLLRIRTAAGGYTVDRRVNEIQIRANNLLQMGKDIPAITVSKAGKDVNIYANTTLFMTVTAADAKANSTTTQSLANTWAQRLRTILPQAKAVEPGTTLPE